ncbi:hypothetical protein BUALT_Bualt12G0071600 [Buddleja alternifolia]|uniref:Two-component response regulator n=1 Tax=Buddleja alternifolia TaxID=168488 RepID=A0AAV6WNA5_9LAMI|nr:hypothetical protein BUALT_Bualt12G0071600 [Buddleja alternifolia]
MQVAEIHEQMGLRREVAGDVVVVNVEYLEVFEAVEGGGEGEIEDIVGEVEFPSTSMAFYDPMMLEVHVLLVDHDKNSLFETCRLLQFNLYKVTPIQDASVASLMLSKENSKFDLVMVDVNPSNSQGFKLVQDAVNVGLTVIMMSANANATLVKCAIEDGAFLFMEKPMIAEDMKYLWQHVLREKLRKGKENGEYGEPSMDNQNYYQAENLQDNNTTTDMIHVSIGGSKNNKGKKGRIEDMIDFDSDNSATGQCMTPKMCTEWTPELHEKFMAAVKQLGDGRCFPKEILEIMNVPGLTRMQVASHLQKCRYGWQPRRSKTSKPSRSTNSQRSYTKRYGLFPRLIKGSQPQCTIQGNQIEEQGPTHNEYLTPSQNMGRHEILDNVSNNTNINGLSSGNVQGNVVGAQDQGLQSDASYGFASADYDGLIENNFDFEQFDYDQVVSSQTSEAANNEESSFWNSWRANFASDDLENRDAYEKNIS